MTETKQSGSQSIPKATWTNILSVSLSPGTYIITGQLNIVGSTDTPKYIALTDASMSALATINLPINQIYGQSTKILQLTSAQTISISAYSQNEIATVSSGTLSALKIK